MIDTLLVLIPALPLAAFLVLVLFGRALGPRSHWPVVAGFAGSCVLSLMLLLQVQGEIKSTSEAGSETTGSVGYEHTVTLWRWAEVQNAYDAPSRENADTRTNSNFTI